MRSLRFLTWNLAMLERSEEAPAPWEVHDTEEAVRDMVLAADVDVICFQELPGLVPFVETHDMIRSNPRTHSGNLATLVENDLMAAEPPFRSVAGCALLTTFTEPSLTIANVHLAPGPGPKAAALRSHQLAEVAEASPTPELLIIGDTNTRVNEMGTIEAAGFHGRRPDRPTWDSERNRYRSDGPTFKAYFTRWFASPGVSVTEVAVWDGPMERSGRHFHLSDHFALSGRVSVNPPA